MLLPTFQSMANEDPLNRRVVEQMLVGVATRQYARSLDPLPSTMKSRGTSKSAVSRRFVAKTAAQLAAWPSTPLDGLDLVALILDGVHVGDHCLIVALGIAADGQKHALGLWDGSTENATICQNLLANLQSRGLRTDRSLLVILDGSKSVARRRAGDVRGGRLGTTLPNSQISECVGSPAGAPAPLGSSDSPASVSERRADGAAASARSHAATGQRVSKCG